MNSLWIKYTLETFSLHPFGILDVEILWNPKSSKYFQKEAPIRYDLLPYYATIDDVGVGYLVDAIVRNAGICPKTTKRKLKLLLKFFKQNFKYMSDLSLYGVEDYWELPANFITNRGGDCDGYAFAFCCMANYLGIITEPVILKGNHMIVRSNVDGKYVYIDPVSSKYNVSVHPDEILKYSTTSIPSQEFLSSLQTRN